MTHGLCKCHPDFHLPAGIDVGKNFDADAYIRRLKECHVDTIAFFAKCHYGHAYYPTKIGTPHPGLAMDMLGAMSGATREHGMELVVYLSVFLDSVAVRQHPEWRVQATDTATDAGFDSGHFQPVCVNSPYFDELFLPQCLEVVTNYAMEEVLLDTMTGFRPCFCDNCKRLFGHPIPKSSDDPRWLEYVKWYADKFDTFFARTVQALYDAAPDVSVLFNWEWGIRRPTPPPPHVRRLCADLISTGTIASLQTRYFAGTGLTYDYMTGRFLHGLGEWNSNTPESLKYTAAATVANAGSFYLIDRQLPDGSLEERAYTALKDTFSFLDARREVLTGTRHVPEIAVLNSYDHIMGPDLRFYPESDVRKKRMEPFEGVVRMFIEHGHHFTGLSVERFMECGDDYRVLVVPEQEFLTDAAKQALRSYLERGGRVLFTLTGESEAVDRDVLELAGVRQTDEDCGHYSHIDIQPPTLVRGHFTGIEPVDDVEVLCSRLAPFAVGKFGHGYAPPTDNSIGPAVVSRRVGQGEIILVAFPVFKSYQNHQVPALASLVFELVDRVLPDPLVRVTTPAQVEMAAVRKGDDLIVHLVNHSGRERLGYYHYPVTEYMPEIRDITVAIRKPAHDVDVVAMPGGRHVRTESVEGYLTCDVPRLEFLESLLVPGYFGE